MDLTSALLLLTLALRQYENKHQSISEICGINKKMSDGFNHGGQLAGPKDWPWMASVMVANSTSKTHHCGGSLISDRHILTAAHCFLKYGKNDVIVRLGEYQFDDDKDNNPIDFNVVDIQKHPEFNSKSDQNDIAILKLDPPTTFGEFILPICLPPLNNNFEDVSGYVIGWGRLYFDGPLSNILREVFLPIWKQKDCVNAYVRNRIVQTMMCGGGPEGGLDACPGDSGGPLMVQISPSARWHVAGIVSFGTDCGHQGLPGVYTRVNMYLDWIKENSMF